MQPTMREAPAGPNLPPPEGLVADGAEWETVAEGYVFTDAPTADSEGNVFYAEPIFNHLYRISPAGEIVKIDENTQMTMGLIMGADGFIYACRNRAAQIVRYSMQGEHEVLYQGEMTPLKNNPDAPGEFCNDLAINAEGGIWFTDRVNQKVMYLDPDGNLREVAGGFRGNGIVLSADRRILAVTNSIEPRLHAFEVGENGALTEIENFFDPLLTVGQLGQEQIAEGRPGTDGMTVDTDGRFYAATFYGVQVFDRNGKYIGVVSRPKPFISNLGFGGPKRDWLYASGRLGLYRLKMQVKGVSW
jgi:sugar lactone lactonase YvrE